MADQLGGEKLAIGGEEEVRLNLIDQYSMVGRFVDNWLQRYHPRVMGEKESHSLLLQLQLNNVTLLFLLAFVLYFHSSQTSLPSGLSSLYL
jgi:hypothetical protein